MMLIVSVSITSLIQAVIIITKFIKKQQELPGGNKKNEIVHQEK